MMTAIVVLLVVIACLILGLLVAQVAIANTLSGMHETLSTYGPTALGQTTREILAYLKIHLAGERRR